MNARQLGQSISKTAALVGCSRSAAVSICQKWSKERTAVNQWQGHGRPRLTDAREERRLTRVVWFNRRATVAQIDNKVNAGSDRKVSEYTVHAVCCIWGCIATDQSGWTEQWKKVTWSNQCHFDTYHLPQHCFLPITHISTHLSICGMCWTNRPDPWRPHPTTYRT